MTEKEQLRDRIEELESRNFILSECFERCQAENQKIIDILAFYANPDTWRVKKGEVWDQITIDAGERARQTINEIWGVSDEDIASHRRTAS